MCSISGFVSEHLFKSFPGRSWKGGSALGVAVQWQRHLGEFGFCLEECYSKYFEFLMLNLKKCCGCLSP